MKRYLVLALIVLAVLSPFASAYTTLFEGTLNPSGGVGSMDFLNYPYFPVTVKDYVSFAGNVTYMKVHMYGYKADNLTKQYYNFPVNVIGYGTVGTATVKWTWAPGATYSGNGIVEVWLYNLTKPSGLTGLRVLRIGYVSETTGGIPVRNWRVTAALPVSAWSAWNGTYPYLARVSWSNMPNGTYEIYGGAEVTPAPPTGAYQCNLLGSTLEANPYDLVCWPAETISPAAINYSWTIMQPDASTYQSANETLIKTLDKDGWYGLNYTVCNEYGCGHSNTTQLVNITSDLIPETGISFWVHTYDPITGAKIGPSDIGIGNVTSGGWRNSSTNLGTAKFDSTDYARLEKLTVGQNVNLCGEAPGYRETCTNVSIAYNGWEYILNLVRTDLVPAGNQSTMIVNVINSNTAQTISGVALTVSNSSVPYSSSKLSDSNGIATFSNIPSAGSYQISASKTGYVSATKFWPVYPGAVANAYIGMLPVGATPVPTSTGGDPIYITPTTTTTYAPGETPDTRTDAEKDEDMMNLLRDQGPMLIQFFIVCFVVYMVMGMAGKGGR